MTCSEYNDAKRIFNNNNLPQFINVYNNAFEHHMGCHALKKSNHSVYCISEIKSIEFINDFLVLIYFDMKNVFPKVNSSEENVGFAIPRTNISYIE